MVRRRELEGWEVGSGGPASCKGFGVQHGLDFWTRRACDELVDSQFDRTRQTSVADEEERQRAEMSKTE